STRGVWWHPMPCRIDALGGLLDLVLARRLVDHISIDLFLARLRLGADIRDGFSAIGSEFKLRNSKACRRQKEIHRERENGGQHYCGHRRIQSCYKRVSRHFSPDDHLTAFVESLWTSVFHYGDSQLWITWSSQAYPGSIKLRHLRLHVRHELHPIAVVLAGQ